MEARSTFIRAKYSDRRYAIQTTAAAAADDGGGGGGGVEGGGGGGVESAALCEDLLHDLKSAVVAKDISGLLQCLAEGLDIFSPLLNTVSLLCVCARGCMCVCACEREVEEDAEGEDEEEMEVEVEED